MLFFMNDLACTMKVKHEQGRAGSNIARKAPWVAVCPHFLIEPCCRPDTRLKPLRQIPGNF